MVYDIVLPILIIVNNGGFILVNNGFIIPGVDYD